MINTWSELFAAIKNWFNAPIKFVRKVEQDAAGMAIDELLKPPRVFGSEEWNKLQREGLKRLSDTYFNHLRDRLREGEHLSDEELSRLQKYYGSPDRMFDK